MNKGVLSGGEGYNTIQTIPAAIAEEFPDEVQSATTSCSLFGKEYRLGEHKFMLPTGCGICQLSTLYRHEWYEDNG